MWGKGRAVLSMPSRARSHLLSSQTSSTSSIASHARRVVLTHPCPPPPRGCGQGGSGSRVLFLKNSRVTARVHWACAGEVDGGAAWFPPTCWLQKHLPSDTSKVRQLEPFRVQEIGSKNAVSLGCLQFIIPSQTPFSFLKRCQRSKSSNEGIS